MNVIPLVLARLEITSTASNVPIRIRPFTGAPCRLTLDRTEGISFSSDIPCRILDVDANTVFIVLTAARIVTNPIQYLPAFPSRFVA